MTNLGLCVALGNQLIISSTFLLSAKETPKTSLRINTVCNFQTMKSAVELNKLLLKLWLLLLTIVPRGFSEKFSRRQCNIQPGITWESKRPWSVHFSGFHRAENPKSSLQWAPWYCLQDLLASLQTTRYEILGGQNV